MTDDTPMEDAGVTVVLRPSKPIDAEREAKATQLPVIVEKPIPYIFDLGNLLATDSNPLPGTSEADLQSVARDGAQALINQLLTTCPIRSTPSGVLLSLPPSTTPLPREKRLPVAKPQTKWQAFAAKKGIKPKARGEGKVVYDEATGEWIPKWGYKGANKKEEEQWIVEVDEKKERESKSSDGPVNLKRSERKEAMRRNERKMRSNERRVPKPGV